MGIMGDLKCICVILRDYSTVKSDQKLACLGFGFLGFFDMSISNLSV